MHQTLITPVPIIKCSQPLNHNHNILLLGSCFSEYIGNILLENHFNICINPTGILYNPVSILNALDLISTDRTFTQADLFFFQDLWRSWHHHSRFADPDPQTTLKAMNQSIQTASLIFKNLHYLIITPGTSFIYNLKGSETVVANCHRYPQNAFERKLLPPQVIYEYFSQSFRKILQKNPALRIILSLSPVRHLRDSPHENQVSKSYLMTAIYNLEQEFPQVSYFPSYEIMMDELRDYRFYDTDMVHPNQTAITIIWENFRSAFISDNSNKFIEEYEPLLISKKHKIQYPHVQSTVSFAQNQIKRINALKSKYPQIDFSDDLRHFTAFT